jgi:hypothetical protein
MSSSAALTVERDAFGLIWTFIPSPCQFDNKGTGGTLQSASFRTSFNDLASQLHLD